MKKEEEDEKWELEFAEGFRRINYRIVGKNINFLKMFLQETYGPYVNLDPLPTKEDFDSFDLDQNGILFFEEWLSGQ